MNIAITFDDGPCEKTDLLLQTLAENNVKATFFLIGQNITAFPEQASRIFAAGHEIGNHSGSFTPLGVKGGSPSKEIIRGSLDAASATIRAVTGTDPICFRAPNLDYSDTLESAAGEMGMVLIGADVSSKDWEKSITTEEIINNVLNAAKDGGIILLHEHHGGDTERTIRAVPVIVRELCARGYEIMSVSGLVQKKGGKLEAGKRYDNIN